MDPDTLDRDVSAALEPDAAAVERVLRAALGRRSQGRPFGRGLLLTAGATVLLAATVVLLNREPQTSEPAPTHVTNIGNTIVVRPISGGIWLIGSEGREDNRLPAGTIVVYRPGARR